MLYTCRALQFLSSSNTASLVHPINYVLVPMILLLRCSKTFFFIITCILKLFLAPTVYG